MRAIRWFFGNLAYSNRHNESRRLLCRMLLVTTLWFIAMWAYRAWLSPQPELAGRMLLLDATFAFIGVCATLYYTARIMRLEDNIIAIMEQLEREESKN